MMGDNAGRKPTSEAALVPAHAYAYNYIAGRASLQHPPHARYLMTAHGARAAHHAVGTARRCAEGRYFGRTMGHQICLFVRQDLTAFACLPVDHAGAAERRVLPVGYVRPPPQGAWSTDPRPFMDGVEANSGRLAPRACTGDVLPELSYYDGLGFPIHQPCRFRWPTCT